MYFGRIVVVETMKSIVEPSNYEDNPSSTLAATLHAA